LVKVDDMAGAMSVVGIRLLSDEEEVEGGSRQVRGNEIVVGVVVVVVTPCSKTGSPAGSGGAGGSR